MAKKTIVRIITALFALLFMYTSVGKIIDYQTFRDRLAVAPYIGQFSGVLFIALPLAELVIVVLLWDYKTRYWGLWVSFIAMLLFTVYIALMLVSGLQLPCVCTGLIEHLSWPQHLIFNIVSTLAALTGIILIRTDEEQDHQNAEKQHSFSFYPSN